MGNEAKLAARLAAIRHLAGIGQPQAETPPITDSPCPYISPPGEICEGSSGMSDEELTGIYRDPATARCLAVRGLLLKMQESGSDVQARRRALELNISPYPETN